MDARYSANLTVYQNPDAVLSDDALALFGHGDGSTTTNTSAPSASPTPAPTFAPTALQPVYNVSGSGKFTMHDFTYYNCLLELWQLYNWRGYVTCITIFIFSMKSIHSWKGVIHRI